MAEIHILPARLLSADQTARLTAHLTSLQEEEVDLGSRVEHIQSGAETLLARGQRLKLALGIMHRELSQVGVQDQPVRDEVHLLLSKVQQLADCRM